MGTTIALLLALQDCDANYLHAQQQLETIPRKITKIQATIEAKKTLLAEASKVLQKLEDQQKNAGLRLQTVENQLAKYKTQQLSVKKSEEYEALDKEFATCQTAISTLEEEQITLLLAIDERKAALNAQEQEVEDSIGLLQKEIEQLQKQQGDWLSKIEGVRQQAEAAMAEVPPKYRQAYQQTKHRIKLPPFVVPLAEHRCQGCHLRVSNDVLKNTHNATAIAKCENCGRILYIKEHETNI